MALAQHVTSPLPLITPVEMRLSPPHHPSRKTSQSQFHQKTSHIPHRITASLHYRITRVYIIVACVSTRRSTSYLDPSIPLDGQSRNKAPITKESCERVAEPQLVIQLALSRNRDGSFSHCDPVAFFEDKAPSPSPTRYPDKWDQLLDVLPIAIYVC